MCARCGFQMEFVFPVRILHTHVQGVSSVKSFKVSFGVSEGSISSFILFYFCHMLGSSSNHTSQVCEVYENDFIFVFSYFSLIVILSPF